MTTVRRTKKALDVEKLEADLDAVDPSAHDAIDATPLRDLFALVRTRELLDNQVTATIAAARSAGISWGYIAEALGVSRQAARQKYDPLIEGLDWATMSADPWPLDFEHGDSNRCVVLFEIGADSKMRILRSLADDSSNETVVGAHRFFGGGHVKPGVYERIRRSDK